MKRVFLAILAFMAIGAVGCGGNPCEKLVKHYCEQKKNEKLCTMFTEKVEMGMPKEACESTLGAAK
ncbi:MAG: hypothetical protein ISR64_01380 [Deltaproteobacteria bacterium]|nr:hypothetical protein [Deltaproteobacteria bacterium]